MPLIEVNDAGFNYEERKIFENISFRVNTGELFCIAGPNGCGKTTLLDCILGLKNLQQGSILISGKNIYSLKPREIAEEIAYVPQAHEKTFPYTVFEIVLMGRAFRTSLFTSPSKEDMLIAEEALETVGLAEFKSRPYTQLSGGEGQLVLFARALAQKSRLIILDEPTAHLDFKHELLVLEKAAELVKKKKLSIIMATHFLNHAFYFEHKDINIRLAMMNDRKISYIGSPQDVLTENNIRSIYNILSALVTYNNKSGTSLHQIVPLSTI